ncbi:hypothetical protein RKD23_001023 [Streptomyces sp. SAI-170]
MLLCRRRIRALAPPLQGPSKRCVQSKGGIVGHRQPGTERLGSETRKHGPMRLTQSADTEPAAREASTGMQPSVVVEQIALARCEAEAKLAVSDSPAQCGQIRMDERTPPRKTVLTEPDRYEAVGTNREHLAGVARAGAEVGGPRLGERDSRCTIVGYQSCQDVAPVGEQYIAAFSGRLETDQEHQAGRVGHAGTLCVCLQIAAAEAGQTGAVGVHAGVLDGRQSVRAAVRMRDYVHQPTGEVEYRATTHQARNGHQSGLPQPGAARIDGVRGAHVDMASPNRRRRTSRCSTHHRAPSR